MRVGYARVSTAEQELGLQQDALQGAGCAQLFCEVGSGARRDRPQLEACLDYLRAGDTLVVWRLDRLGRSLGHLIDTVAALERREVGFASLTEGIDTTTAAGRMVFHVFGALAEFERDLVRERTQAGLAAARARGRVGGRPSVMTPETLAAARVMRAQQLPMSAIARTLRVSRATLYRHLAPPPDVAVVSPPSEGAVPSVPPRGPRGQRGRGTTSERGDHRPLPVGDGARGGRQPA